MAIISDLPIELLIKIFHLLDLVSLVSVRLTKKSFSDILDSVSLQYSLNLQASGHVDQHNYEPLHLAVNEVSSENSSTIRSLAPSASSGSSLPEFSTLRRNQQLSLSQKLSLLQAHESAWLSLDLRRKTEIDVVHRPSNIYDLSSGVYVLGDAQDDAMARSTHALRYVDLGERVREAELLKKAGSKRKRTRQLAWPKIDIGVHIVDIGFALHEHDLVACLSTQFMEPPPWQMNVVELNHLHLIQFSTGRPHPLASCPVIPVEECLVDFHRVSVMIEIVGPLLLLLLTRQHSDDVADKLFLYDWMRGELLIKEIVPRNSYYGFIILNPELAVLPNIKKGILEIIRLPLPTSIAAPQTPPASDSHTNNSFQTEDTAKQQIQMGNVKSIFERICLFELPEIAPLHSYSLISCRADPNPFGYAHTYKDIPHSDSASPHTRRGYALPFTSDPYSAIALFQCYVNDDRTRFVTPQWARRPACFSFILQRNALINVLNDVQAGNLMIKDEMDGIPRIAWSTWGPLNTRWSSPSSADDVDADDSDDEDEDEDDEGDGTRWITITAGQREVFLRRGRIVVRDYNPWNVRKAQAMERQRKSDADVSNDTISDENSLLTEYLKDFRAPKRKPKANVDGVRVVDSTSYTASLGYFTEPIESCLPYVETISEKKYPYDGILMDEERIIGLLTDEDTGTVKRMDVFTLSPDPTITSE